ncbi:hypothetical protein [Kitasatospora sp. NPDC085464]|uniref:hypothetical protein n=1 Tax=Kitasatospora sp. NPDC085464 TaxID=3364063 RepID=UPI0037CB83B8
MQLGAWLLLNGFRPSLATLGRAWDGADGIRLVLFTGIALVAVMPAYLPRRSSSVVGGRWWSAPIHTRAARAGGSWWAPELDVGAGGRWWLPARSCADRKLPLPKNLPTNGPRDNRTGPTSGLPGFAPAKNPEAQLDVSQQVTTRFAPICSCTIGTNPTHDGRTKVFAITTDPRTTALTQKDGKDPAGPGRPRWVVGGSPRGGG